jgi:hypothetical protein
VELDSCIRAILRSWGVTAVAKLRMSGGACNTLKPAPAVPVFAKDNFRLEGSGIFCTHKPTWRIWGHHEQPGVFSGRCNKLPVFGTMLPEVHNSTLLCSLRCCMGAFLGIPTSRITSRRWRPLANCRKWRRLVSSALPSTTLKVQTILRSPHGFPEAQRLRDVRPKAGECGKDVLPPNRSPNAHHSPKLGSSSKNPQVLTTAISML